MAVKIILLLVKTAYKNKVHGKVVLHTLFLYFSFCKL